MQIRVSPLIQISSSAAPSLWLIIYLNFALNIVADNLISIYSNTSFTEASNIAKAGCWSKCGDLIIPYPFGINSSCSLNSLFTINCDASFNPPKAFIGPDNLEILGIYDTKIRVRNQLAWGCYDKFGNNTDSRDLFMNLSSTPLSFSTENKLTVVGCDDMAILFIEGDDGSPDYVGSCVGICSKPEDLSDGLCGGIGCCESSIPKGLVSTFNTMTALTDYRLVNNFTLCGYSFLAEQNSYTFNVSDISDSSFVTRIMETVPIVLEWAIGNKSCYDQIGETICQAYSVCDDSSTIPGRYRCSCSQGFHGNPYLSPGCQDINECKLDPSPCHQTAKCVNLPGSFDCSCPLNYIGNGTKNGPGCIFVPSTRKFALYAGLLVGFGSFLLLVISFWLYKVLKKRRVKQLKQNFFKRNGGLLLQQQMSAHDVVLEKMRIFTSKELERATDQFSESRILGRGGQGTVYKGMLPNGRIIAVKKSKQVNQNLHEEFINEVVILSQVNHRNVVNLLGCCMETEVPLLVYEFISNGTLYDLIHDQDTGFLFSWDHRLRVGVEISSALAYLHYATSIPIYHRDMKSTNILLDIKYRAKLSDFGISRLVEIEQSHLTTKVKGTFGYLDPEYFRTGKFTEKSDVYSFGVVLLELLTGQKPIATSTTDEEESSLVTRFLSSMEENSLETILDSRIIEQGLSDEHIAVSDLAKRCLNSKGKKRPTIREVATELVSIRKIENPSFVDSIIQDISSTETGSSRRRGFLMDTIKLKTDTIPCY